LLWLQIKLATGLSDVNDIVRKFLTKEEAHLQFVNTADDYQTEIDKSKKQLTELKTRLGDIQLSGVSGQGNRELYKEIDEHDSKLAFAKREARQAEDRMAKLIIISDQLKNCVRKILVKLDSLQGQDPQKFQVIPRRGVYVYIYMCVCVYV
jgi:chromosome segregation ATPase